MHVSPGRFSDKTDKERKLYSLDWVNALAGSETIATVNWSSEPAGLVFEVVDGGISGAVTQVYISGGTEGQSYRVRCRVTLTQSGEEIEASVNDEPGIPMQVLGRVPATRGYLAGGYVY